MKKITIYAAAVALAAVAALAYQASNSDARWHVLSDTAINTNKLCRDGVRYTWAAGQTQTKPPATRPVGAPGWVGPIALVVQYAPATTPGTEEDWFDAPLAGADVFTAPYRVVSNATVTPTDWYPYSYQGVVPFRAPLTAGSQAVRLDAQPNGNSDSTDAHETVANCLLFAALDFKPNVANTVDLSTDGQPSAALLSSSTYNAARIAPSSARFGATGSEAAPLSSSVSDVNGDGRNDLVLKFQRSQTGIVCSTTRAFLSAIDPATGKRFYEADSVQTTNCP